MGGVSVIAVLASRRTCPSAAVGVPSLAIPWAQDDGRDQDGLITGPSVGASRAASMRSILAATRAAAFLTG